MKILTVFVALAAVLLQAPAHAVELADCQLNQSNFPGLALRGVKLKPLDRYFMEVEGALKNGMENTYERDEAVLNVDVKVVRTTLALVPSVDVTLKSSWPLAPSFRFVKGVPVRIWYEAQWDDDRRFGMFETTTSFAIFFDQSNEFCNKSMTNKPNMQVWHAGTLSKEPDGATFERTLQDDIVKEGSLRIIYLGTSAGAMRLQEVWVQGSRIGKSITRTFDQFSKSITVAGFKFDVIEAKGDKLKLRYEISSRTEITEGQATQISLQNSKLN